MTEKYELICDDLFFKSMIGIKHYLSIGLIADVEILDGILDGYVMVDFKNVKVNETSGTLNLTFTVDVFNKKFKKI